MRPGRGRVPLALPVGLLLATASGPALGHLGEVAEPDPMSLLTSWSLEPLPWIGALLAAAAYLIAVRRVNRAHPARPVPGWRVVCWLGGLGLLLASLVSALDEYSTVFLSAHMVQHLLLALVVPPVLALGAPVTLALRVASPRVRQEALVPVLHSRAVRVIGSPFVAWPLFAIVLWATHFSPLYNAALEDPLVHDLEHLLYLAAGALFWWPVVGADPRPRRLRHGARMVYLGALMPVGSAIGLVIYFAPTVLYPHYASLERSWGPSVLVDQQIGGLIMWGAGDLVLLVALALLVAEWMRADARRSRRADQRVRGQE